MFYPFVAFFILRLSVSRQRSICSSTDTSMRWPSNSPQSRPTQPSQVRAADRRDGRKAGKRAASFQDRCLIRILPLKLKYKGKTVCVCVCVSLIMQCQSSLHVCSSCSNMIFFHDGMTLRLPLIWENLEHAGTSLGKRSIWKSIWVWVNVRISPFFHSRDTDCVELGDWNTVLETHK